MAIVVQKYGGSSVADVQKLGQVADKVVAAKRAGHDVVVVVSAMGKKTDELLALAKSVAASAPGDQPIEPPRRELDMLVSTGERVSMALLSIAIHARGHDAISFTGSQSGIITSDRHFDARIIEVRPHRIEDELARGKIVIVAGYQGMSYRREITTLGRGGSDTTAVALAAALGAERCEIYSDVDGVYSADPRVVSDAAHLPELDLATLQEMAEAGAKVLNAQAVEWARRAKIAIFARKTGDPAASARETVAREDGNARVRAVVGLANVAQGSLRASEFAAFARLARELGLPLFDVGMWGDHATFAMPLANVPDWSDKRRELQKIASISLPGGNLAIVSLVGSDVMDALPRFIEVVSPFGRGPVPEKVFSSPLRLSAHVDTDHLEEAQRALHRAFVH